MAIFAELLQVRSIKVDYWELLEQDFMQADALFVTQPTASKYRCILY